MIVKIDEIREKRKLSYGKIAKITGLSAQYIQLLAKGHRKNPSFAVMLGVAAALGESYEKVFIQKGGG